MKFNILNMAETDIFRQLARMLHGPLDLIPGAAQLSSVSRIYTQSGGFLNYS